MLRFAIFLIAFNIHTFFWEHSFIPTKEHIPRPVYQYTLPTCGPSSFLAVYKWSTGREYSLSKAMFLLRGQEQNGATFESMIKLLKKEKLDIKPVLVRRGRVSEVVKSLIDDKRIVLAIVNSNGNPISESTHWFIIYKYDKDTFSIACSNLKYYKINQVAFRYNWIYEYERLRNYCVVIGVK